MRSDLPVHVHSVQEEYFYLMVHPCVCGGVWLSESQEIEQGEARVLHEVAATCSACGTRRTFRFHLDAHGGSKGPIRQVNPTAEPSRALDVVEWMTLAEFYLGRIEQLTESVRKAQSLLDARQCLEEALKFYRPRDDGPPASALWSDASRRKVAEGAKTFRRTTVEAMLDRLPPLERLRQADSLDQKTFEKTVRERAKARRRRRWWQFWKPSRGE